MVTIPSIPVHHEVIDRISWLIADRSEQTKATLTFRGEEVPLALAAAAEVYTALDNDGGVPTAEFIIWLIDSGQMTPGTYVGRRSDRRCACFFGGIALCETAVSLHIDPKVLLDGVDSEGDYWDEKLDEYIYVNDEGKKLARHAYHFMDILAEWRDGSDLTVVEHMLIGGAFDVGATAETNDVLRYLRTVLQTYISDRVSVVAGGARA